MGTPHAEQRTACPAAQENTWMESRPAALGVVPHAPLQTATIESGLYQEVYNRFVMGESVFSCL